MNPLEKLLRASPTRATRLHTQAGDFCGLAAVRGLAPAGITWTRQRLTGVRAREPWWVWEAIRFAGAQLRSSDRVLETGGGVSTLWLAERVGAVVSIEESAEWRERIADMAQARGVRNLQLQPGPTWPTFCVLYPAVRWDAIVVDGPAGRLKVFEEIFRGDARERPRLIVYDDTDRAENRPAFALAQGYHAHSFRGFKPQTLHACETTVFVREGAER